MKNGFEASAARPPEMPASPRLCRYLRSGDAVSSVPERRLKDAYTPKRTLTLLNCQKHPG